jgi:hypothetical protein
MRRLISIEIQKLRTTPAVYVSTAIVLVLTVASVISNILSEVSTTSPRCCRSRRCRPSSP